MCNNDNCSCIEDILKTILKLQKKKNSLCDDDTCTRPFLGPATNVLCFNTRPISLYSCCDHNLWSFPYTLNGEETTSSVFRVEAVDDCCVTCRVLAPNPDATSTLQPYVATNSFATININCIGAITCHNDLSIDLI